MLKVERQKIIRGELQKQGFVLVPALGKLFNCSEETIRRDLKEMENNAENVIAAQAMLSGPDDFTTKLWWANQ